MDIHNYKRRFDRTIERIKDSDISKGNKKILLQFKDSCICENISYGKIDAYLFYLMKFTNMLQKAIEQATKEDLMRVISELNQTQYSEETKISFNIAVRKIYKMIRETEDYPPEVKWIPTNIKKNKSKIPEELLTEEEIQGIIRAGKNIRDKTLLSTLAESGCRVGEIGTLKIKHVSFEEYGARITVAGKTGMRKILLINSTPYLQEWINQHPLNNDSESYLWHNPQNNSCLSYARIAAILKAAAKKAGIKKRVYLHLLRHTRATRMASIMTDASMKAYFGWTQSSKMAGVYIHMNGKDTDEAVLRANGIEIKKEDKPEQKLKPIKCQRCKTINETTNKFCKLCGLILDKEEADKIIKSDAERQQADDIMDKLIKDPEILGLIKEKLNNKIPKK
jgi:site-specific recombinase XerD